ncbi:hypothetical protein [Deinococcus hopiensis]|uniref:hypothetical protein n=1 Tax=Deinococcus hopiensis TaxID=309885 RepID=UPI001481E8EA|nr:hypothetical protein [Deinococcus hopiensis]
MKSVLFERIHPREFGHNSSETACQVLRGDLLKDQPSTATPGPTGTVLLAAPEQR